MKNNIILKNRAWIEIDLKNLTNNVIKIKKIIPKKTKVMAVVKANAYGHGDVLISKKLQEIGITDFAVATLDEGIRLRQNGITGNILILGFTNFENLDEVIKYNLIQTIVDYNYSEIIKNLDLKQKLKCHIKIDTGMHRIGENYDNIDNLSKIYENKNLDILGVFSHFCTSDSNKTEDVDFTNLQIKRFNSCINKLKKKGYNVGKIHLQNSYGTINYPHLDYDYVRMGILMYGVNSSLDSYNSGFFNLKPVLSLKARVTSVKTINKNESVSYGRTFIANDKLKIATISIGYADGIPRSLSNKNILVKIKGAYVNIIGRICMDQLVIDISNIQDIEIGSIVTLIGTEKEISAEVMSDKAGTITNELLCRLGNRLNVIVKE